MDLWDQADSRTWHLSLPAMTVGEYVSGETESLFIREERGTFWLSDPRRQGQSECKTLEEAKKAGDEIVDEMYESQPRAIAEAARLPEGWVLRGEPDGFVFFAKEGMEPGEGPEIVRNGPRDWTVVEADEEVVSKKESAAEALAEFERLRSFSPSI